MSRSTLTVGLLGLGSLLAFASGCDTEAYCFSDCEDGGTATVTGTTTGDGGGGSTGNFITSSGIGGAGGGAGGGACQESNGGTEICDQIDNDCNDVVDDIAGQDYSEPKSCGLCSNNCYVVLLNFDPLTVTCIPSVAPGVTAGTCEGDCAADYHDLDMDGQSCEYYCVDTNLTTDAICDGADDDCDNLIDEDVDLCTDELNCGLCGGVCSLPNATPQCVNTPTDPPIGMCTQANTKCEILMCDAGYIDLDGFPSTGCEYQCTPTGPELCDGQQLDEDCDGALDALDSDLTGDPNIGVVCNGDPDGICGLAIHEGLTACVAGNVQCTGPDVLFEGDTPEACNNLDDDCDGLPDSADTVVGQGAACGPSNNYPCAYGTQQCNTTLGMLECVGSINPTTETCNGVDDNCDTFIDKTGTNDPADSVGACGTYVLPMGATSPCQNGTKACQGGTVQCVGDVVLGDPGTNPIDGCGTDLNCDGALTNQPNKMTDVNNCMNCGNDCDAGKNANYTCVNGMCVFGSCLPGFYDFIGNDGNCETACDFVSSIEACNGNDDNCNGQVDEMVPTPSKVSVCGIDPAASRPECTTGVTVACVAGAFQCSFPMNVCAGGCSAGDETCDGLDNDCDGFLNENVADFGQACASDDGLPAPGHGACRDTGTKVCNGGSATMCDAMKNSCTTLPGGCAELCDGVDNDCDGSIDETFNAKGTDPMYFVAPNVVKISTGNLWMYQYEASRPTSDPNVAGSGNGYWTSAPPGETLDQTPSCSLPNRIPWFNVTPLEAEQTCAQMGGFLCGRQDWTDGCRIEPGTGVDCTWGYANYGAPCRAIATGTKFCNLAAFDFDADGSNGDQDGVLPTASASLQNCFADWDDLGGNGPSPAGHIFDVTGNLREITKLNATTYIVMGGAFNTQSQDGATCTFDFYAVDEEYKFYDAGFRCCFSSDPRN